MSLQDFPSREGAGERTSLHRQSEDGPVASLRTPVYGLRYVIAR